jgi:hypothetical protein
VIANRYAPVVYVNTDVATATANRVVRKGAHELVTHRTQEEQISTGRVPGGLNEDHVFNVEIGLE